LIFKGSGFYITDHRKTPASSDGDGKAPAAAKTGSEAKPSEPAKAATPGEEKKTS
jgi:predicted nucleic acid-binding Zn ribbon protein